MILVDFSSIVHRMIHTSVANVKPNKLNGEFITKEFVGLTKYFIFQELFSIMQEHGPTFGDMVICLDNARDGYWRRDFYSGYKSGRRKARSESEVNFGEVFTEIDGLIEQFKLNVPWKVLSIPKAEADDTILVLSRKYNEFEPILIHSPDKDMIQAQRNTDSVKQYSALTKKWIVPETKHDDVGHWILEHVCLGDAGDDVPKVVDATEFSPVFLKHIEEQGYDIKSPTEFKASDISETEKFALINDFDVYRLNRKGDSTGVKDVYKKIRFGPSTLAKAIKTHGSLDNWLDSHPMYRDHYDRNFILVMEEGIPSDIFSEILVQFKEAKTDYNNIEFEKYLNENDLKSIVMELPNYFKINRDLTGADFGW